MAKKNPDSLSAEGLFGLLCKCAEDGVRCPENGTRGMNSQSISTLCRDGRIRVEISGQNYRQVHILTGPQKGLATAPPPGGQKPWKIVGRETKVNGSVVDAGAGQRPQPSAPRPLPADYFKD